VALLGQEGRGVCPDAWRTACRRASAVIVRHPKATQSELEIAVAASADVIREEKRRRGVATGGTL